MIYERRVKTRSGGLYLRDGERINPTLRHGLLYMYIAWSSTLCDDLLQTRGYDIKFVRPLIYDEVLRTYIVYSNHQFRVTRLWPTPTYLIHVIMVTHCLSIITHLQHRVIYTFPVILVVSVEFMPVTCTNRTINWFFKFFKFYEFNN